jgi:hypothetical protein
VSFTTGDPGITLAGTITSRGGPSTGVLGSGGAGGAVAASALGGPAVGNIVASATITVSGGDANVAGPGGTIGCTTIAGTLSISGSWVLNGGVGTATGGPGGIAALTTNNDDITMTGTIAALGGNATGAGGPGGRVIVNSDADNDLTGGDITLATGATINVSGGGGATGGAAGNDGGASTATLLTAAVVFDAEGFGTLTGGVDGVTAGIITNNGTITAAAGAGGNVNGGDIIFDGIATGGVGDPTLTPGTAVQAASGAGQTGFFLSD